MTRSDPKSGDPQIPGTPLGTEGRRELLAQIERASSRGERPEDALQRAEQELRAGRLDTARRLFEHLEKSVPDLAGLDLLRGRLRDAEAQAKHEDNRRKAEEMLLRFIQQRNKAGAQLALETLLEIVPDHPFKNDYRIWVNDLDKEVALQQRIDAELAAGRAALQAGDAEAVRRSLEALRKIEPDAPAVEELARELEANENAREESADIARHRQRFDELVERLDLEAAEAELETLAGSRGVPKVTLDFLRKRLEEARGQAQAASDLEQIEAAVRRHVETGDWQAARDAAHEAGQRFRGNPRATQLYDEVIRREAEVRRRQSIEQGVRALEDYLAAGKRREAELALRVLQGLDVEPDLVARFEAQIQAL